RAGAAGEMRSRDHPNCGVWDSGVWPKIGPRRTAYNALTPAAQPRRERSPPIWRANHRLNASLSSIVTGPMTWQALGVRNSAHPRRIMSAQRIVRWPPSETGMVDEDVQRSAEELRETAAKLRQLARQTRFSGTRGELLNLAERFATIAAQHARGAPPDTAD